jgi:uncharacterized surface protein with fasciclin (FAS1) repeats
MRTSTRIAAVLASAGLAAAAMAVPASAKGAPTLVDRAVAVNSSGPFAGQFDTLLAAAQCSFFEGDVVDLLSSKGQKTLFAPTDGAFAALGEELAGTPLTSQNICAVFAPGDDPFTPALLGTVLGYHVTEGRRSADWLGDRVGQSITMLAGGQAAIGANASGGLTIDGANVVAANVPASNGFIHAVDKVLLP